MGRSSPHKVVDLLRCCCQGCPRATKRGDHTAAVRLRRRCLQRAAEMTRMIRSHDVLREQSQSTLALLGRQVQRFSSGRGTAWSASASCPGVDPAPRQLIRPRAVRHTSITDLSHAHLRGMTIHSLRVKLDRPACNPFVCLPMSTGCRYQASMTQLTKVTCNCERGCVKDIRMRHASLQSFEDVSAPLRTKLHW